MSDILQKDKPTTKDKSTNNRSKFILWVEKVILEFKAFIIRVAEWFRKIFLK